MSSTIERFSALDALTRADAPVILKDMKCDTCGKTVQEVKRVVVDAGYDRTLAKALYNCQDCYRLKEDSKKSARAS